MKLNEAKYRSPEWLRNFVDFEVNTGEDIKGEPSKRKAAKLEKEKQAELKRQAEEKVDADRKLKQQQQRAEANKREQQAREDSWKKQADAKEKQDQIEREINTLYRSMISDFSSARYSDKITTPQRNGKTAFYYTFENGKIMRMYKNTNDNRYCLEWETHIYTLGLVWTGKFINLANEMTDKGGARPRRSGYDRYDSYGSKSSSGSSGSSGRSSGSSQRTSSTPPKWKDHPKGTMYQNLKDTVKLREEQLKRSSGSDREALQNELNAAKRMLDNLNKKYSFESNIQNFSQFNQIFEKSKFVETDEFNELLDKINDTGITSLTDIEKKRLDLFSMDDEPILDIIDRMADLTSEFKMVNKKIKQLSDEGKTVEAKNLFRDKWSPMNDEMIKLEREIKSYGIEVGDETFMSMMNKHRADVYGYDPDREGDDELEMDM
jgi:hypothetical protein